MACSEHVWEVVDTYQINDDKVAVVRKCFECDEEFIEEELIRD